IVLSKDGGLHSVANRRTIQVESVSTSTARKIMMYDSTRGYILDGSGRFIRFAINGASLPPAIHGVTLRQGQDFYRAAVLNPNKQHGYLVGSNGHVYEFGVGSNATAPAVSATTVWEGVDKAIDITISSWSSRQGYV